MILCCRHLYWTNLADPTTIHRALYDGTEEITLFPTGLTKPGPITVDPTSNMLFWADSDERTIQSSDLSGGNRKVLLNGKQSDQVGTILGLAVLGDYLYWVDKDKQFIGKIHKTTGREMEFVQGHVINLSDIHAATYIDPADVSKNQCSKHNGGCSHICIPKKNQQVQCSCPNNLVLKNDEQNCAEKTTCGLDEFACKSGNKDCIPKQWLCDGRAECSDNSDEEDCPICGSTEFQCKDGTCIKEEEVCDGIYQCADRNDEDACCENRSQIKCLKSNKCYDKKSRCDGKHDCPDHSDEEGCLESVSESTPQSLSAHVTVAIVVGGLSIVFLLAIAFFCRRKSPDPQMDDRDMIMLTKPLNPSETPPNTIGARSKKHDRKQPAIITATLSIGSDSNVVYDRNHVTGASSSSSAVTQYPKETLNPPPSPVTDRSVCAGEYYGYTTNSPSTTRSFKKHRRRQVPPPPTTPCSTDVCEDSEPYFPTKYYNNSLLEVNYDSDPYPPPPTPRSHYFSDDVTSCPDSPTTERSYFHPYPPPPSPVPNSDC